MRFCLYIFCFLSFFANGQTCTINTFAGTSGAGYNGDGMQATTGMLNYPISIALDGIGNVYIADAGNHRVRKVDTNGILTTIAGTGNMGYTGDNGPAILADLNNPEGVSLDSAGNIIISEFGNHIVRKVDIATGNITTIVGIGTANYSGDGGLATAAELNQPVGIAYDSYWNLFIADYGNYSVRKIDKITGIISTVAGNGVVGFGGDGGPATLAKFASPSQIAFDNLGNMYVTDQGNNRVRIIDMTNGIINTIAGNGTQGFNGDGILATNAQLFYPFGIHIDNLNNLYITDSGNSRVRRIDNSSNIITTIAGNGTQGFNGDGIPPLNAELNVPTDIKIDTLNNLFIVDGQNHRVRKIDCVNDVEDLTIKYNVHIFPNPNNGKFTINYDLGSKNANALFNIYDIGGKLIQTYPLKFSEISLEVEVIDLAAGIYIYKIYLQDELLQYGKISVVE